MYTRGLRDEGAQRRRGLAQRPWGIPAPAGDAGAGSDPPWGGAEGHQPQEGCGAAPGEEPKPNQEVPPQRGQTCPAPRPYSLDVAVVEGAVVLHLQMKNISEDTGLGTAPAATARPQSWSRVGSERVPPTLVALLTRSK